VKTKLTGRGRRRAYPRFFARMNTNRNSGGSTSSKTKTTPIKASFPSDAVYCDALWKTSGLVAQTSLFSRLIGASVGATTGAAVGSMTCACDGDRCVCVCVCVCGKCRAVSPARENEGVVFRTKVCTRTKNSRRDTRCDPRCQAARAALFSFVE